MIDNSLIELDSGLSCRAQLSLALRPFPSQMGDNAISDCHLRRYTLKRYAAENMCYERNDQSDFDSTTAGAGMHIQNVQRIIWYSMMSRSKSNQSPTGKFEINTPNRGRSLQWLAISQIAALLVVSGCKSSKTPPPPPAAVVAPSTPILFQPVFEWSGKVNSKYATGFFGRAPDGRVAAVTCSSQLKRKARKLNRICWMDVVTGNQVDCYVKTWGPPGKGGVADVNMMSPDVRTDYFILRADDNLPAGAVLELDARKKCEAPERVWFPNKNADAPLGYDLLSGYIRESHLKYLVLELDAPVRPKSINGTPVISELTGRVIGIVSRDARAWARSQLGEDRPGSFFLLTPSSSIVGAMEAYDEDLEFDETFGRRD